MSGSRVGRRDLLYRVPSRALDTTHPSTAHVRLARSRALADRRDSSALELGDCLFMDNPPPRAPLARFLAPSWNADSSADPTALDPRQPEVPPSVPLAARTKFRRSSSPLAPAGWWFALGLGGGGHGAHPPQTRRDSISRDRRPDETQSREIAISAEVGSAWWQATTDPPRA